MRTKKFFNVHVAPHRQAPTLITGIAGQATMVALAIGLYVLPVQAGNDEIGAIGREASRSIDAAPAPGRLQSRLDALQQITVTKARAPAADVPAATQEVQSVLDAAAAAEQASVEDAGSAASN